MLTFEEVKNNSYIQKSIKRADAYLEEQGYTDHGKRHLNIVSQRAEMIGKTMELEAKIIEYAKIAGWTHDMANFLSRANHHYLGSLLFFNLFSNHEDRDGVILIMEAIANHDKAEAKIASPVTAILIIADKSDVHRTRVRSKSRGHLKENIHSRVNYSVTKCDLNVSKAKKIITLKLSLDERVTSVMEYFEIFLDRMKYCKQASNYLGYKFKLVINGAVVM